MTYFIQEFTLPECGAEPLTSEFVIGPTLKIPKASFSYGTISIKFLINQDFSNYYAVVQWILENTGYESFITGEHPEKGSSDEGSLILLTNKKNAFRKIDFCCPKSRNLKKHYFIILKSLFLIRENRRRNQSIEVY